MVLNKLTLKVLPSVVLLVLLVVLWYLPKLHFTVAKAYKPLTEPGIMNEQANVIEHSNLKDITTEKTRLTTAVTPTRFIYLTQTENCIPADLKSPEVIGDSEACQCDVIILSYKKKCDDTSLPHVQYLFNSSKSTTWTVGRNLLYEAAKERKETYIHYIFMDDDVKLHLISSDKQNPWRMYEESLKTFQPAVVIIQYHNKKYSKEIFPERVNCEPTRYVQIYFMDAIFNAFHYQAIDYILPYTTTLDSVSWFYSQVYTNIKCNILFNKEVVIDPRFVVENKLHRNYTQGAFTPEHWINIISEIRSEVPEKYRASVEPILQQWLTSDDSKGLLGQQTCKRDLSVHPYRPYENLPKNKTLVYTKT
ncbi:uncharacterized protein LOC135337284 [Halichondria panicea]|uniref:uncharacterized protein LOC135337284 n=1 Tax=Halichondria panicea TaxID=6063 RepID=UPI00312B6423